MTVTVGTYKGVGSAGWTVITLPAGDKIIYVSSTQGNDANNGLSSVPNFSGAGGVGPKRTLLGGLGLITAGSGDWLLLRVGDTWTDEYFTTSGTGAGSFIKRGRSTSEPILVSSYDPALPTTYNPGTGARPLIINTFTLAAHPSYTAELAIGTQYQTPFGNLAIIGLEFYSPTRDFHNVAYTEANANKQGTCISVSLPDNYDIGLLLVEDCLMHHWSCGVNVGIGNNFTAPNVGQMIIRRNVFHHIFSSNPPPFDPNAPEGSGTPPAPRPQAGIGILCQNLASSLIDENIMDLCGWDYEVSTSYRTTYDHAIYYNANDQIPPGAPVFRGNIFTRSSCFGIKAWAGGLIDDNFFDQTGGGIQVSSGTNSTVTNLMQNCVVLRSMSWQGNPTGAGWGQGFSSGTNPWGVTVQKGALNPVTIDHCIVAHDQGGAGASNSLAISLGTTSGSGSDGAPIGGATISNCITFDWQAAPGGGRNIVDYNGTNTLVGNVEQIDNNAATHGYSSPNRTTDTYAASLGLTGTMNGFMAAAYTQSKATWNPDLTGWAANDYVRAGFNVTGGGGGPVTTVPLMLAMRLRLHA